MISKKVNVDIISRGIPVLARYSKENFLNNPKPSDGSKKIGAGHNAMVGQIALAWPPTEGNDIVQIPGTMEISIECQKKQNWPDWICISRKIWKKYKPKLLTPMPEDYPPGVDVLLLPTIL